MPTLSMRPAARTLTAAAGLAALSSAAFAQGRLEWQVSPALQETWTSSLDAKPGQSIDLRLVISYTGSQPAVGLASVFFQPAIRNWDNTGSGAALDRLLPFRNDGGATTTPTGDVPDAPGQYGRITPFGWRDPSSYLGHVNTVAGTSYLRIAQAQYTSWVGGAGNTQGGGGVNVGQVTPSVSASDPRYSPFQPGLSNLIVMKLGITLSTDTALRTLLVDTAEHFANQAPNFETRVKWYASLSDVIPGSVVGDATYVPATINVVPAPGTCAAMMLALTASARRRRR